MAANGEGFLSVCRRGVASPRISGFLRMVRDQRPRGAPPFEKSTSSCQATARPMSDVRLAVGEGRTSQCVATPMPQDEDFEGLLATMMAKAAFPSALHSRICWRSTLARSLRRPRWRVGVEAAFMRPKVPASLWTPGQPADAFLRHYPAADLTAKPAGQRLQTENACPSLSCNRKGGQELTRDCSARWYRAIILQNYSSAFLFVFVIQRSLR